DELGGADRIKKLLEQDGGEAKPEPKPVPPKPEPKREPRGDARPWFGVQPEDLTDDVRAQLKLEAGVGVAVDAVPDGSPAAKAGLKPRDIIVNLDGKPVKGEEGLAAFMESAKIGQAVKVTYLRKGKEEETTVTLAERP